MYGPSNENTLLSTTINVAPQPPGRTLHRSALRPGGETLLIPGASPRTPMLPEAREAPQGRPPARGAKSAVCHHVHMADADLSEGERTVLILNPHWKTVLWPFVLLVVVVVVAAVLLIV